MTLLSACYGPPPRAIEVMSGPDDASSPAPAPIGTPAGVDRFNGAAARMRRNDGCHDRPDGRVVASMGPPHECDGMRPRRSPAIVRGWMTKLEQLARSDDCSSFVAGSRVHE